MKNNLGKISLKLRYRADCRIKRQDDFSRAPDGLGHKTAKAPFYKWLSAYNS